MTKWIWGLWPLSLSLCFFIVVFFWGVVKYSLLKVLNRPPIPPLDSATSLTLLITHWNSFIPGLNDTALAAIFLCRSISQNTGQDLQMYHTNYNKNFLVTFTSGMWGEYVHMCLYRWVTVCLYIPGQNIKYISHSSLVENSASHGCTAIFSQFNLLVPILTPSSLILIFSSLLTIYTP